MNIKLADCCDCQYRLNNNKKYKNNMKLQMKMLQYNNLFIFHSSLIHAVDVGYFG